MARSTYGLMVPGNKPKRASDKQKVTLSDAISTSHTDAKPMPPA